MATTELLPQLSNVCADEYLGGVFLTQNCSSYLKCAFCEEKFEKFNKFLHHINLHLVAIRRRDNNVEKVCTSQNETYIEEIFIRPKEENLGTEFVCEDEEGVDQELETAKDDLSCQENENTNSSSESAVEARLLAHPYKCEICERTFKAKCNYSAHVKRHNANEKRWACENCPKKFFNRAELRKHEHYHKGIRRFMCEECGQRFFTSSSLKEHNRRHTNTRPYKCNECDKRFFDNTTLANHMVIHTKERNYICQICQQSFARLKTLRTHEKLHENKKQYSCHLCAARFNQKPSLIGHIKYKHLGIYRAENAKKDKALSMAAKMDEEQTELSEYVTEYLVEELLPDCTDF